MTPIGRSHKQEVFLLNCILYLWSNHVNYSHMSKSSFQSLMKQLMGQKFSLGPLDLYTTRNL